MSKQYTLNRDQTVAVATGVYWNHDMSMCPCGVKVQLKSIGGVACYDSYKTGDNFWVAWAPVPRDVPQPKGEKNVTFPPIDSGPVVKTPMGAIDEQELGRRALALHKEFDGAAAGLTLLRSWAAQYDDYDKQVIDYAWSRLGRMKYMTHVEISADAWHKIVSEFKDSLNVGATENSGGNVSYYLCPVTNPNQAAEPYVAECSDIIEALGMDFNEGEAFKAIWRKAAERTLGKKKAGNEARRDVEKVIHYGKRMLAVLTGKKVN